mmetsp:Transcript_3656/g.4200  ORF Transcript_3656/g.4200 Transcript_3656/m.4200 type:complete len:134 (+) Transcript_3656:1471-1872(+)
MSFLWLPSPNWFTNTDFCFEVCFLDMLFSYCSGSYYYLAYFVLQLTSDLFQQFLDALHPRPAYEEPIPVLVSALPPYIYLAYRVLARSLFLTPAYQDVLHPRFSCINSMLADIILPLPGTCLDYQVPQLDYAL